MPRTARTYRPTPALPRNWLMAIRQAKSSPFIGRYAQGRRPTPASPHNWLMALWQIKLPTHRPSAPMLKGAAPPQPRTGTG
eukprot:275890-Chlamydomonas_euryale.AAC.2